MDYLRAKRVCCASDSLGIPGTLTWRILSVPCLPFRQIPLPRCFVVGGFLCLRWAFTGTLAWRVPGLLRRAFLAHSRRCLDGPYPHHYPLTCKLCRLGVLPSSGFSFWCHWQNNEDTSRDVMTGSICRVYYSNCSKPRREGAWACTYACRISTRGARCKVINTRYY